MKKLFGIIVIAASLIGLQSCQKSTPEEKANFAIKKATKKLDLNEVQVGKLEKVKVKALDIYQRNKGKKEEFRGKIKDLILAEKIDEGVVKELIQKRRETLDLITPEILPEVIDFHASLSAKQKKMVVEFLEKMKERRSRH